MACFEQMWSLSLTCTGAVFGVLGAWGLKPLTFGGGLMGPQGPSLDISSKKRNFRPLPRKINIYLSLFGSVLCSFKRTFK